MFPVLGMSPVMDILSNTLLCVRSLMDDLDFENGVYDGPRRPRLRAILVTILFPFIMGALFGSIIKHNSVDKLLDNPGGLAVLIAITTGASLLIWGAGLYQAIKKGRAFGMQKNIWSAIILGGHVAGLIAGMVFIE